MKNAIAIRHVAFEDAGTLDPMLKERGIGLSYLEAGVDDLSPAKDADLLVVLGGPIGIYEVDRYPFLKHELSVIEAAVKKGVPVDRHLPRLPGACRCARRPRLSQPHQAFTYDPKVLALQFHVELPERHLERWLIGHTLELSTSKIDLAKMRTDTARFAPAANAASQRLFNEWLDAAV